MSGTLFQDTPRTRIGLVAFVCFLGSIPLANWMIHNVGTVCVPNGPCLVPVAPGWHAGPGLRPRLRSLRAGLSHLITAVGGLRPRLIQQRVG